MSKDLQVCPCTHPHPTGGICPYSPELCSSCGAPLPHAEPTWCESTGETTKYPPAPTFDLQKLDDVPRPASVEEAIDIIRKLDLAHQHIPPCFDDKVREIIQNRDVVEFARVSSWIKSVQEGYGQEGEELIAAMDFAELYNQVGYGNYIGMLIVNEAEKLTQSLSLHYNKQLPGIVTKLARDAGCVDLLRSLTKKGVIDPSEVPTWPPSETAVVDVTTSPEDVVGGGGGGELLLETLRKTIEHVGELLTNGDVAGARSILKRIPPATARKALAVVPPYRADIVSLLMHDHDVVDPTVYIRCLRMMENYYYRGRAVRIRRVPFVYPLVEGWSEDFPWTIQRGDPFGEQYMTLFPQEQDKSNLTADAAAIVSRAEFEMNVEGFLGYPVAVLGLREHSLVMAGGCVVACLMPSGELPQGATVADRTAYFRTTTYEQSDVDLFSLGPEGRDQSDFLKHVKTMVDGIQRALGGAEVLLLVRTRTITIIPPYPHRRIQIHIGPWPNLGDVVANSDVDCTGVGYDGHRVVFTLRAHFAWTRRCNVPDVDLAYRIRGCPTYEKRLLKYAMRGFSIVDLGVPVGRIGEVDDVVSKLEDPRNDLNGLKGLVWLRTVEKNPKLQQRRGGGGGDIPFGPTVTHQQIVNRVMSNGYCPSDNYGTHESGYLPCVWWCRGSVLIPVEQNTTWNYTYFWHGVVRFYIQENCTDPETHRFEVPCWYCDIPSMLPTPKPSTVVSSPVTDTTTIPSTVLTPSASSHVNKNKMIDRVTLSICVGVCVCCVVISYLRGI